jgi:hypothetical protein
VLRRFAIFALLAAWFCAQGALLDVLQILAWSRMFSQYAETQSLAEALTETFDAAKPCPLCLSVRQARAASENKPVAPGGESARDVSKLVLALPSPSSVLSPPTFVAFARPLSWEIPKPRENVVPLPPPRSLA